MKALELIQSLSSDDQILLKNVLEIQKAIHSSDDIDELAAIYSSFSIVDKTESNVAKSELYQGIMKSCRQRAACASNVHNKSFLTLVGEK